MKRLLGDIRRADERFELIGENARVAVGLSGGKDSMALLALLAAYRAIKPFSLCALTIVPKGRMNPSPLEALCESLAVPLYQKESALFDTLFQGGQKNPCALCARVRRGTLVSMAKAHGCDTLALGHHLDDALETLLMALLKEGRFHTLAPKSHMARGELWVIRPLILTREHEIEAFCARAGITPVKNPCPVDHKTTRQEMKALLARAEALYPDVKDRLEGALLKESFFMKPEQSD